MNSRIKGLILLLIIFWSEQGFTQNEKYDVKTKYEHGLAAVAKDRKIGFVDKDDKLVIPIMYEDATMFTAADGIAIVKLNGKLGAINTSNEEVIPIIYSEFKLLSFGFILAELNGKVGYYTMTDDNSKLKLILPVEYEKYGEPISPGYVRVAKDSKVGMINNKGEFILKCEYEVIDKGYYGDLIGVKKDGFWGYANKAGKIVVPTKYVGVNRACKDLMVVKAQNEERYKVINSSNEVVADAFGQMDKVFVTGSSSRFVFKKDGKYGVCNEKGKVILQNVYSSYIHDYKNGHSTIKSKHGIGLMVRGEIVVPPIMDKITYTAYGFHIVEKDGMYGLFNSNVQQGQIIGLMMNKLKYNRGLGEYSYKLLTSSYKNEGEAKITGFKDNVWSKFKVNGSGIGDAAVYNPKSKIYIYNDTKYTQVVFQRKEGYSASDNATKYIITAGELRELPSHKTGDVFLSVSDGSVPAGIENARKIVSIYNKPENCGTVVALSSISYLLK